MSEPEELITNVVITVLVVTITTRWMWSLGITSQRWHLITSIAAGMATAGVVHMVFRGMSR